MARCALKRSLRPASCCSVDVMNGAAGERRKGRSVTDFTVKVCPVRASATEVASSSPSTRTSPLALCSPSSSKSLPVATAVPPSVTRAAPKPLAAASRRNVPVDAPPRRRAEPHAGPLALDHHPRGDALHPPGREPRHHLAPQDRRDLVAVEPVEDAPRLLRVHQPPVEVAPLVDGPRDRGGGDLVEHHALHRHGRVEDLGQVPRDRLALAVLVRREVELVGRLEEPLEVRDDRLLGRRDHVERLEPVVHVDAEARPRFALDRRGHFVGAAGQVADVADRRLDDEVGPEHAADGARLGRRLDDDERLTHDAPRGALIGTVARWAWSNQSEGPPTRLSRAAARRPPRKRTVA